MGTTASVYIARAKAIHAHHIEDQLEWSDVVEIFKIFNSIDIVNKDKLF